MTEYLFNATFMLYIRVIYLKYKYHDLSIIWLVISQKLYKNAVWTEHVDELKTTANDCLYDCTLK